MTPETLFQRLVDQGLDDKPFVYHVLAACADEQALATLLNDGVQPRPVVASPTPDAGPLRRMYLKSVQVRGFRGIGGQRSLELHPANGLTVVTGRNGSGKSSFAEAVEVVLTGACARLRDRRGPWKDGWRNLDEPSAPWIAIELTLEGTSSPTIVQRKWNATEDLEDPTGAQTVVKKDGATREISSYPWRKQAAEYRPFLAYSELGELLEDSRSQLHDALLAGLGLKELEEARKRLVSARTQRKQLDGATSTQARDLLVLIDAGRSDADPRIARLGELLRTSPLPLEAIDALVANEEAAPDDLEVLRGLSQVHLPDVARAQQAAVAVLDADANARALARQGAGRALQVADLLDRSLSVTRDADSLDCPVCRTPGMITEAWRVETTRLVGVLRTEAEEATKAARALDRCLEEARQACGSIPPEARRAFASPPEGVPLGDLEARWQRFVTPPIADGPTAVALHLREQVEPLALAVETCRAAAARQWQVKQDVWLPLAQRVRDWLPEARKAQRAAAAVPLLDAAEKWLKNTIDDIRTARFTPIAEQAISNWKTIRLQSSVDLRSVALAGTGNQRKVELLVEVDGNEAVALGVMSQGELNSLALSLFLPRASLPESPFGFMLVDDPVQALDPSKVEGLARILSAAAAHRQVVVFTHDDRLPEAIRRLSLPARFLDVSRRARSIVDVRPSGGPAELMLDDARAVARTPEVPDWVKARVVPTFCRGALEAASMEAVRARRFAAGQSHEAVESAIADAERLRSLVALAVLDDARKEQETDARLSNAVGSWAKDALHACRKGAHGDFDGSPEDLIGQVERLTKYIKERSRGVA